MLNKYFGCCGKAAENHKLCSPPSAHDKELLSIPLFIYSHRALQALVQSWSNIQGKKTKKQMLLVLFLCISTDCLGNLWERITLSLPWQVETWTGWKANAQMHKCKSICTNILMAMFTWCCTQVEKNTLGYPDTDQVLLQLARSWIVFISSQYNIQVLIIIFW